MNCIFDIVRSRRMHMLRLTGSGMQEVGGLAVTAVRDLGTGLDTSQPDGMARLPWSPGDMMITYTLDGGGTLTCRASGTEPKLKYYLEVCPSQHAPMERCCNHST